MRKVSCKVCLECWSGRRGNVYDFYEWHIKLHGLKEPERQPGEPVEDWLDRRKKWHQQYFEDSHSV